jgi:hypothetical protein
MWVLSLKKGLEKRKNLICLKFPVLSDNGCREQTEEL